MDTIDANRSYYVRTRCPACGILEDVLLAIVPVLVRTDDEAKIGLKVGQEKAVHRCHQLRIDTETGELSA